MFIMGEDIIFVENYLTFLVFNAKNYDDSSFLGTIDYLMQFSFIPFLPLFFINILTHAFIY